MPQGERKTALADILEQCTKNLFQFQRYRNDVRYLRIWIQYADICNDPSDIFKFLESNEIGQGCSLFYEAYATFLEFRGKYNNADQIYQDGIAMKAQPQDKLRKKFEAFQNRMAKRIQARLWDGEDASLQEDESLRNFGSQQGRVPFPREIQKAATDENTCPANGNALEVFADEDLNEAGAETAGSDNATIRWPRFQGTKSLHKENVQIPATWDSVSLPAKNASTTAGSLEMYQDPELLSQDREREIHLYRGSKSLSSQQQLDALRGDGKISSREASGKQAKLEPARKRQETLRFSREHLMDGDGEELCLEELRLKEMGLIGQKEALLSSSTLGVPETSAFQTKNEEQLSGSKEDLLVPEAKQSPSANKPGQEKPFENQRQPVLDFGERVSPPPRFGTGTDQTINTKEAFADIMSMFNDTLPIEKMDRLHQAHDGPDEETDPFAVSGRAAHPSAYDCAPSHAPLDSSAAPDSLGCTDPREQDTCASASFLDIREDTVFLQPDPEDALVDPVRAHPEPGKVEATEETVVLGRSWLDPTSSEPTVPLHHEWELDDAPTVCWPATSPADDSPLKEADAQT